MKTSLNNLLILAALNITILSCSKDDVNDLTLTDNSEICSNTEVFDPLFTGTACCIQRNSVLNLNDNIAYEYSTNIANTNVEWRVGSGDIEIISGGNSNVVTIKLSDSFTEGSIYALGTGTSGEQCSVPIVITRNQ